MKKTMNGNEFYVGQKVEVVVTFIDEYMEYHQGEIFTITKIEKEAMTADGYKVSQKVWLNNGGGFFTSDFMVKHFKPCRPEMTNLNEKMKALMNDPSFLQKFAAIIEDCENVHPATEVCDDEDEVHAELTFREPTQEEWNTLQKNEPGCTIPVLVLEAVADDGTVVKRGYLTPFRAYRFQVSGTITGSGDFGSSPVINLLEIARMHGSANILLPHAQYAVQRWFREYGYVNTARMFSFGSDAEKWFDASIDWLKSRK